MSHVMNSHYVWHWKPHQLSLLVSWSLDSLSEIVNLCSCKDQILSGYCILGESVYHNLFIKNKHLWAFDLTSFGSPVFMMGQAFPYKNKMKKNNWLWVLYILKDSVFFLIRFFSWFEFCMFWRKSSVWMLKLQIKIKERKGIQGKVNLIFF
jgi:hypothetical protein